MSALELEIPKGYLKTEYGIFPSDWSVLTLDDVCSFAGGAQPEKSVFSHKEQSGYIRLIQIRDYKSDKDIVYIPEKLARKKCLTTDIMIGRYGPPIFQILRGIEGAYNVALIKATPKENIEREFLYYFLKNDSLFELMDMLSQRSSGQTGVELPALKSYPIGLPTKKEQIAIANALSDVDALISEQEKLIAKKQAIKTATMQQLLTGRTRLPQFALREDGSKKSTKQSELGEIPEDWEVVNIGDLGQVDPENLGSTTSPDYEFNYVSLEQIEKGVLVGTTRTIFRNAPSRARRVLKKGDILVSTVRPNLMSHYFVQHEVNDLICSTGFSVIRFFEEKLCPGYLYQHLFSSVINNQIEMLISGSNYPAINSGDVKQLKVQIGSVEEQTAIATILSDMDKEIQALKQRLSKTYQIKQGMMQELLTGKTRLIKPSKEVIHE